MPAECASSLANRPTAGSQQAITSVGGGVVFAVDLIVPDHAVVLDGAKLRRFVGVEEYAGRLRLASSAVLRGAGPGPSGD